MKSAHFRSSCIYLTFVGGGITNFGNPPGGAAPLLATGDHTWIHQIFTCGFKRWRYGSDFSGAGLSVRDRR